MLDLLNNNSGLLTIINIAIGLLSLFTTWAIYRLQKNDGFKKEQRECFRDKAEFEVNNFFGYKGDKKIKELSFALSSYKAELDKDGYVATKLPKDLADNRKLKLEILVIKNIGNSDVNELEVAVSSPKSTALIDKNRVKEFVKNNHISYSISLDRKVRKNETIALNIYYLEKDPIINMFSASLEIYYRDSLNNICAQSVFPEQKKIYEPRAINYLEWQEQVSVKKNLEHWERRLANKARL